MENYDEFALENLNISDSIKESALAGNKVDQLHVMLRAMSILGFRIQDHKENIDKRFDDLDVKIDSLTTEVKCIKRTQRLHSKAIRDLDRRLTDVEKQIA